MRSLRLLAPVAVVAFAAACRTHSVPIAPFRALTAPQAMSIREITSTRSFVCDRPSSEQGDFAAGVFFGDSVRTPQQMRAAMASYARRYGSPPGLVKIFYSLEDDFSERGAAGSVVRTLLAYPGVTPLISLEPTWNDAPATGLLDVIGSGGADDRVTRMADGLGSAGAKTVLVELGAEMNARFGAPWQAEQNGGDAGPAAFIRAWQHVVRISRDRGAGNLRWVFAPSAGNPYTHQPTGPAHWNWYGHWYPGVGVVDYVGLHAFNHARDQGAWIPFNELVGGDAADGMLGDMLMRFPHQRVILGELATSEHPDRADAKAGWIAAAYKTMRGCKAIAGVVWFDMQKEADWNLDSSPAAAAAYGDAVRGRRPFDEDFN